MPSLRAAWVVGSRGKSSGGREARGGDLYARVLATAAVTARDLGVGGLAWNREGGNGRVDGIGALEPALEVQVLGLPEEPRGAHHVRLLPWIEERDRRNDGPHLE